MEVPHSPPQTPQLQARAHAQHSPQSLQPALRVPQGCAQQLHPEAVQGVPSQVEFLEASAAGENRSEVLTAGAGQLARTQPATDPPGEKRPSPAGGGGTRWHVSRVSWPWGPGSPLASARTASNGPALVASDYCSGVDCAIGHTRPLLSEPSSWQRDFAAPPTRGEVCSPPLHLGWPRLAWANMTQ